MDESGTSLDVADTWCRSIHLRTRPSGKVISLAVISRRIGVRWPRSSQAGATTTTR